MNREETVRGLSAHRDAFRKLGIALYGSVVRDQDRTDSDVDLLVDVDRRRSQFVTKLSQIVALLSQTPGSVVRDEGAGLLHPLRGFAMTLGAGGGRR